MNAWLGGIQQIYGNHDCRSHKVNLQQEKAELLLGKSSSIQFVNKQNSIRILANGREPHDSNFEITEY